MSPANMANNRRSHFIVPVVDPVRAGIGSMFAGAFKAKIARLAYIIGASFVRKVRGGFLLFVLLPCTVVGVHYALVTLYRDTDHATGSMFIVKIP